VKYAFANPYNLSLLSGALAVSAITLNPIVAVAALGVEALWMLHAPSSRRLQQRIWDKKADQAATQLERQDLNQKIALLDEKSQTRVRALIAEHQRIDQLTTQNASFSEELMHGELSKSWTLVQAFVDMALTCWRYERYLDTIDPKELERNHTMWQHRLDGANPDPRTAELAKKNLEILEKRNETLAEIRQYIVVARGQLDLIENTFHLIADQIVTMRSPKEMTGQLDQLLSGVEAVRSAAISTEGLLE